MNVRAAFFLCVIGTASAQQPAVIRTETKVVLVDVVVTGKKGVYPSDLAAKDFHVWDNGKEQKIDSVTHGAGGNASASQTDYVILMLDYAGRTPRT